MSTPKQTQNTDKQDAGKEDMEIYNKKLRAATGQIVDARMNMDMIQPHTVARTGARAKAIGHYAFEVGADGDTKVEFSKVIALFNAKSCAVFRLAKDGLINEHGVKAALWFAAAGDRVYGAFSIPTANLEGEGVLGGVNDNEEVSHARDMLARDRYDLARECLTKGEMTILNGVMRFDLDSGGAAASVYPRFVGDKKRLRHMGDAALISACERLARAYGFEK